jgi:hypothetical protein
MDRHPSGVEPGDYLIGLTEQHYCAIGLPDESLLKHAVSAIRLPGSNRLAFAAKVRVERDPIVHLGELAVHLLRLHLLLATL